MKNSPTENKNEQQYCVFFKKQRNIRNGKLDKYKITRKEH